MEILSAFLPYSGPAIAAMIAGVISFSITVLSKDQKTSEFRQAWIDGLRNDVAEMAGMVSALSSFRSEYEERNKDAVEIFLERLEDFSKVDGLIYRIRLRLNPKEHQKIFVLLDFFHDGNSADDEAISAATEEFVAEVQVVLKAEWARVKSGELSYRILKYLSLAVATGAVCYVVLSFFKNAIDF